MSFFYPSSSVPASNGFHYDSFGQVITYFDMNTNQDVAGFLATDGLIYPLYDQNTNMYWHVFPDENSSVHSEHFEDSSVAEALPVEHGLPVADGLPKKTPQKVDFADIQQILREFENPTYVTDFTSQVHTLKHAFIVLGLCLILSQIPFMKKTMMSLHKTAYEKGQAFFPTDEESVKRLIPVVQVIARAWLNVLDKETSQADRDSFIRTVCTPLATRFREAGGDPDAPLPEQRCFRLNKSDDNANIFKVWFGYRADTDINSVTYKEEWDVYARLVSECMTFLPELSKACVAGTDTSVVCNKYFR